MVTRAPAAVGAKRLLSTAARRLGTADPVEHLAPFIDESLHLPPGAQAYRRPHAFETRFSERTPRSLQLGMSVGDPNATGRDRIDGTTRAMRYVVHHNFGSDALHWLDGRSEALRSGIGDAWFGSGFDRGGVREAYVSYLWGPHTGESLARPIHETVEEALDAMPSLRPALTSVHCGREFGTQTITFRVDGALQLADLKLVMDRFGLGPQHTRLVNAVAFVLGARFTLPPETVLITLRPTSAGMEMRLDVDLEGIPDVPANLASLLQLQLVERPQSLAALERWVAAMTPDGYISPGSLAVLSVLIRPNMGPRISIDMRPSVLHADGSSDAPVDTVSPPAPPVEPAPLPATASSRLVGASAGVRSPWDPR